MTLNKAPHTFFFKPDFKTIKIVLLVLAAVASVAMIAPAYSASELTYYVTFTHMNGIKALGNYTFEVTLTNLLKDGNNDEIRGELGYSFRPISADRSEKKYFYMDFSVRPDELPKTFYIDVPFTDTGTFSVTKHYSFSKITHHEFANRWPKGGNIFNSFHVVGEYSKAVDEDGDCKNKELSVAIKPDFSTAVCVYDSTLSKLKERGWY